MKRKGTGSRGARGLARGSVKEPPSVEESIRSYLYVLDIDIKTFAFSVAGGKIVGCTRSIATALRQELLDFILFLSWSIDRT